MDESVSKGILNGPKNAVFSPMRISRVKAALLHLRKLRHLELSPAANRPNNKTVAPQKIASS